MPSKITNGAELREARRAARIPTYRLAEQSFMPATRIQAYERGSRTIPPEHLGKLVHALEQLKDHGYERNPIEVGRHCARLAFRMSCRTDAGPTVGISQGLRAELQRVLEVASQLLAPEEDLPPMAPPNRPGDHSHDF